MKINGLGGLLFNVKFCRIRHTVIIAVVTSDGNAIIYLPNQKSNFFFPVLFPLFDNTHQQFNSRQRSVFFLNITFACNANLCRGDSSSLT